MTKYQQRIQEISNQLLEDYPSVETPLEHENAYQLLVSAVLSPQTPDLTTNKVTPHLFKAYPDLEALSKANYEDLLQIIRPVNYNKTKTKRLIALANKIISDFNGEIPSKLTDLMKLPGIGRKVANVVISEWFVQNSPEIKDEGFVVDTHVMRIAKRLGLSKGKTPEQIEKDLMKIWPREEWRAWSLRLIFHGRDVSQARNPQFKKHPKWADIYERYGVREFC